MKKKSFAKKEAKEQQKAGKETNFNDVLIKLIDVGYLLVNKGNIFGCIVLVSLVILAIVAFRIPSEAMPPIIMKIVSFLSSERYYLIPVGLYAGFVTFAIGKVNKIYRGEIKRLAEHRKNLIHGFETGELKHLEKHNPSKFTLDND